MLLNPNRIPPLGSLELPHPLLRRPIFRPLQLRSVAQLVKSLEESDEEVRGFVVGELLAEADAGTGVEWRLEGRREIGRANRKSGWKWTHENEGVRSEILLRAIVEPSIWVELEGCKNLQSRFHANSTKSNTPSGPQRSFLLCISITLYDIL